VIAVGFGVFAPWRARVVWHPYHHIGGRFSDKRATRATDGPARALSAERDQFPGMFRQGKTEGVDGPLHFIEIKVRQRQRIMQEDAFPCLIEHKRSMHEGAIHLEEASK
jgi:hypothetical protein